MKTYLRILSYAKGQGSYIPLYVFSVIMYAFFSGGVNPVEKKTWRIDLREYILFANSIAQYDFVRNNIVKSILPQYDFFFSCINSINN